MKYYIIHRIDLKTGHDYPIQYEAVDEIHMLRALNLWNYQGVPKWHYYSEGIEWPKPHPAIVKNNG